MKRNWKKGGFGVLLLLCTMMFGITVQAKSDVTIKKGVYADCVELSGLTKEEATQAVEAYVDELAQIEVTLVAADENAEYDRVVEIDLDTLEPLAACPSSPDQIRSIRELAGKKVGQVLVGSCTNGGYRDLAMVAAALKGRKIHPDVTLGIAPGSRPVLEMLCANGMLGDLVAAAL